MFVFELTNTEAHPAYEALAIANSDRQLTFLRSLVDTSIRLGRPMLSLEAILALNYHAIACLHAHAGALRPCAVYVGGYTPPEHFRVPALMNMFIDEVNRWWDVTDAINLATFALWRLNAIHPFINGNGRTARSVCLLVICLKQGAWLSGETLLPELLKANRDEYVAALKAVDTSMATRLDLSPLHAVVSRLIDEQIASAPAA